MKPIRLSEAARQDIVDAAMWYAEQRLGLEDEFLKEVETMLVRIANKPDVFSFVHGDLRRAPVRRFPYSIIFAEEGATIGVIAIMHTSRNPDEWRKRLF